jgi:hypothetical protein
MDQLVESQGHLSELAEDGTYLYVCEYVCVYEDGNIVLKYRNR